MIKACIFDLDGTLLDTLPTISHYGNLALNEFGFESLDPADIKYMIGNGARTLIERMLEKAGADVEANIDKVFKFFMKEYNRGISEDTKPYDGIPELLAELKTMDIAVGVLSNKPDNAARESVKLFFGELIDVTQGARDDVALKPSPEGLLAMLEEFGVSGDECLYIGDTGVDMKTGKNGNCITVGVTWGFRERNELVENGADIIVDSPEMICSYVKEKNL